MKVVLLQLAHKLRIQGCRPWPFLDCNWLFLLWRKLAFSMTRKFWGLQLLLVILHMWVLSCDLVLNNGSLIFFSCYKKIAFFFLLLIVGRATYCVLLRCSSMVSSAFGRFAIVHFWLCIFIWAYVNWWRVRFNIWHYHKRNKISSFFRWAKCHKSN